MKKSPSPQILEITKLPITKNIVYPNMAHGYLNNNHDLKKWPLEIHFPVDCYIHKVWTQMLKFPWWRCKSSLWMVPEPAPCFDSVYKICAGRVESVSNSSLTRTNMKLLVSWWHISTKNLWSSWMLCYG